MVQLYKEWRSLVKHLTWSRALNIVQLYCSFRLSKWWPNTQPAAPMSVSIEPTTACNLGCPECPSGLKMFERPIGNTKGEHVAKWLDQLAKKSMYINFYFQGEPFIHPQFLSLVTMAVERNLFTSTSTNGHFLHPEMARRTVESGLHRLIISIDGLTQEVYEQYRVNGKLTKVIEGTKNIMHWKRQLNSTTPEVIFQFLVVAPNEHQIEDVMVLADQIGVDEVRFKTAQLYDFENGHPLMPKNEKYSRYRRLRDGTYRIKNKLENHCWRMWSGCVITWDGRVVPCCFDKDATHALGQLEEMSFQRIWNGLPYRRFRRSILEGRSKIDICANCSEGTQVWASEA